MDTVLQLIILLISIVLHELAHAVVALRLGDSTAQRLGRITLNPIKHLDPIMSVALPALLVISGSPIIFGAAKPVPVNPLYFKNPRLGMGIVAAAGPLTNIALALALAALFQLGLPKIVAGYLIVGILINIGLAIFNCIPCPPLDGGRIVSALLPESWAWRYGKLEPYGFVIVIVLFSATPFGAAISMLTQRTTLLLLGA
jgi:Zn-dependent protease